MEICTSCYPATSSSATSVFRGNVASRTSLPFSNTRSKNHVWSTLPRLISSGWFLTKSRMPCSRMRWIAHDQTLRARNRTDGPVLRQPVRCGDDLTVVQTEETVVGKSEAWNLETTCGAKLECPLRQQAVQCVVDVRVFDEVATRIHFEHSLDNGVLE